MPSTVKVRAEADIVPAISVVAAAVVVIVAATRMVAVVEVVAAIDTRALSRQYPSPPKNRLTVLNAGVSYDS